MSIRAVSLIMVFRSFMSRLATEIVWDRGWVASPWPQGYNPARGNSSVLPPLRLRKQSHRKVTINFLKGTSGAFGVGVRQSALSANTLPCSRFDVYFFVSIKCVFPTAAGYPHCSICSWWRANTVFHLQTSIFHQMQDKTSWPWGAHSHSWGWSCSVSCPRRKRTLQASAGVSHVCLRDPRICRPWVDILGLLLSGWATGIASCYLAKSGDWACSGLWFVFLTQAELPKVFLCSHLPFLGSSMSPKENSPTEQSRLWISVFFLSC